MGHIYAPPVEFLIPLRPALPSRYFSYDIQARKLFLSVHFIIFVSVLFISYDRFGVNNWRLLAFCLSLSCVRWVMDGYHLSALYR